MLKKTKLFILSVLLIGFAALNAQVTTSSMSGLVSDDNGEPLIGAAVIALHTPSGTEYGAITDAKGQYRLSNLRVGGPYTVTTTYVGFSSLKVTDINLSLAENAVLNISLKEDAVSLQAVEVVGSRFSNMSTDQAGAVTNINTQKINAMPSVDRSFSDLTRLTPQANGAAIGGGTYRQNNITIDGASFNNKFGIGQSMPANGSPISLDAIEQISVSITPYDVRQSGFLGAAINAVTRSGDNEFRGSVYTYLNNEKFKGNKVGEVTFDRSPSSYNLYGVRVGGPIVKNKLFFFLNYETEKAMVPGPSRVAATAEKPYTDGSDNIARPTATDMDMMSKYLKDTYGYETGPYQGYSNESPGMKFLARIDWNINKQHRFNIRYNLTKKKDPSYPSTSITGISPAPYNRNDNRQGMWAMWYQNSGYFQEQNFSSIAAELNSRFDNFNNVLRVTYTDQDEPRSTIGKEMPFVDILKDGKPYVSFGTELFSFGNLRKVNTFTISDDVTFNLGINSITTGLAFEHNLTKNGFQRFGTGYFSFASWEDFVNKTPERFALTHPNNADMKQAFPSFNFNQLTAFVQDEVAFSNRFNMLFGLRFDLPFYPELDTYNDKIAELNFGGRQYNTAELPKANVLVSPRLGFNYDMLGDRSLVLRGGTGLFTGTIPFVWIVSQASDAGVLQTTYTGGTVPTFTTDINEMINQIYPGGFTPGAPVLNQSITVLDRNLKLPQNWKSSVAIDAKLPYNILASVEAVYSKDVNAVYVANEGIKPGGFYLDAAKYPDHRYISSNQAYYSYPMNVYVLKNGGQSNYFSLSTKIEKNFDFGLDAMVAYTYSNARSTTDGTSDQLGSAWNADARISGNNIMDLGYMSYVLPHRLIASVSYRKEYGKHFASTVSLFYSGSNQSRYSFQYNTNLNGDYNRGALIYIPKDESEITFVTNGDYSAEQQNTDFWNFVNQDKYLSSHKGEYALRNGALLPWINTFDFKFMQDFYMNIAGKRNTLQLGLDIMNVGNLLNSNWGNRYRYSMNNFLRITNLNAVKAGNGSVAPTFNFQKNGTEILKESFNPDISYNSTYFLQFSVRYIFN